MWMRTWAAILPTPAFCLGVLCALAGACGSEGKRPLGATCDDAAQCSSGLCLGGLCVDPAGDDDRDGLTNATESQLGSNPGLGDTDGDGIADPDELGAGLALTDTDGDGKPDILESAIADADGDCITDQFDRNDAQADLDVSPMIAVVCPRVGVCAEPGARLGAACPADGRAVCVFTGVPGYANPEVACDGRDENCDGAIDEAFPNGCAAPFVAPGSGGRTVSTARHKATLVLGQPALGATGDARHRVLLGGNPVLSPRHLPLEAP